MYKMKMKSASPPKSSQKLIRRGSIGFSSLAKYSMSTPLIPKNRQLMSRRNPSGIVTLTPKVPNNSKSTRSVTITPKGPNISKSSLSVTLTPNGSNTSKPTLSSKELNNTKILPDCSIGKGAELSYIKSMKIEDDDLKKEWFESDAPVTLDVSGTNWKGPWLKQRKSQIKRKIDWSEEDETVIEKLNETRKKICFGLSSISSTAFETITESPTEEYEEEELDTQNDYEKDTSSVQVIEDKTLVDDAHKVNENGITTGEMKKKVQVIEGRNANVEVNQNNCSTIVLDDTQDQLEKSKYKTDIEDGEIIDDTQDDSVISLPILSPEKLKTKFIVTIPPDVFHPSKIAMLTSKVHLPQQLTDSFRYLQSNKRLRPIVIDGSNVAFAHAKSNPKSTNNGSEFSCRGIKLVVEYFERRGHQDIVAFVPAFRKKMGKSQDRHLLDELEKKGFLAFTPSREVGGQFIASHDDRFILEYATKHGGVVVTRDNFRDHFLNVPEWRDTIQRRLLQPTFVKGELMFPDDPLGKDGVTLEIFLKF